MSALGLLNLLSHNRDLLYKQATSVALMMNKGKTKNIIFNCDERLIAPHFDIVCEAKTLGITFNKNPDYKKKRTQPPIYVDGTAKSILSRLGVASSQVKSSQRAITSTNTRLKLATGLIWKSIYDLAFPYVYCKPVIFKRIKVGINSVIRSVGLDYDTPSNTLYRLTLGISPENIAKKQIICLCLKRINLDSLVDNRYNYRPSNFEILKPMLKKFHEIWNALDLELRKSVVKLKKLDSKNSNKSLKLKLKNYLSSAKDGQLSQKKFNKKEVRSNTKKYTKGIAKKKKKKKNINHNRTNNDSTETNNQNDSIGLRKRKLIFTSDYTMAPEKRRKKK